MRRFLSNFAGGWPGLGLLLIRVAAGAALAIEYKAKVSSGQPVLLLGLAALGMVDGAFLIAGLWTPVAGVLAMALSVGEILVHPESLCPGILTAALGAGVAFVGPGAVSIDAWLFGLRKIDIKKPR